MPHARDTPSPRRQALARMCHPHVHARSTDGAQAATIFSASSAFNETKLWYALDNATGGLLHHFDDFTREQEAELRSPPIVWACGQRTPARPSACRRLDHQMVCHIRFAQPLLCAAGVQLKWPLRRLTAHFEFCIERAPELPLTFAAACTPIFLNADAAARPPALHRLARWLQFMRTQVGRVKLHSLNHGNTLSEFLSRGKWTHLLDGLLKVKYWDIFEATSTHLSSSSHLAHPHTQERGAGNPYFAYDMVFTKCLSEERDDAEWTVIMDLDEYFTSLPPAPALTLTSFLQTLPPTQRQYHFCAVNQECQRRAQVYGVRAKTATRTGEAAAECEPLNGLGHFSLPMQASGHPVPPDRCLPHLGPDGSYESFAAHCKAALSPVHRLSYFLSHEAPGGRSQRGDTLTKPQAEAILQAALANPTQRACIEAMETDGFSAKANPEACILRCVGGVRMGNRLGDGWDESVDCGYDDLLGPERAQLGWSRGWNQTAGVAKYLARVAPYYTRGQLGEPASPPPPPRPPHHHHPPRPRPPPWWRGLFG